MCYGALRRYGWAFGMLMLAECGLETWFADRRSLFAPAVSPQSPDSLSPAVVAPAAESEVPADAPSIVIALG